VYNIKRSLKRRGSAARRPGSRFYRAGGAEAKKE